MCDHSHTHSLHFWRNIYQDVTTSYFWMVIMVIPTPPPLLPFYIYLTIFYGIVINI